MNHDNNPILGRNFAISKVEFVDLAAENWLVGTVTDSRKIDQLKTAILNAREIELAKFPEKSKCQLRITTGDACVTIRYDDEQGLLQSLTIKSSNRGSVHQLSEDDRDTVKAILHRLKPPPQTATTDQ